MPVKLPSVPATKARRPLLLAKLNPPLASAFDVARSAICERVLAVPAARVVLVRAPAGFGKTTVMLQLRERLKAQGLKSSWLTVDEADNDVGRFLSFLSAALETIGVSPVMAPTDDAMGLALCILDGIASHEVPFVLFLDDLETLHNPAVFSFIAQVVEQLPPGAQLVLGSRQVPAIGLGKLRARGRLVEVEAVELRFSMAETSSFLLEQCGLKLAPEQVGQLQGSTEGWAAALWLASLALERREDAAQFIAGFSGSNAAVAQYLAEDVFAKQPEAIRRFLLDTCVLDGLSPALCDALRGASDSAAVLSQLEEANLFLIPLDGGSYRYHSLFAEFLRAQLARLDPARTAVLHQAAARWYLDEGRAIPALRHALASQDRALAVPLLLREAPGLMEEGRFALLLDCFDALPASVLEEQPALRLLQLWAVTFTRGATEAFRLLEPLEAAALGATERGQLMVMRPLLLGMMDRIDESYEALQQVTALQLPLDRFAQGILAISRATVLMMLGRYSEARQRADEARRSQEGAASIINQQWTEWSEGSVDLIQGRLQQAIVRLRLAANGVGTASSGTLLAGVVLAEALYESDQCEQAERLLRVYVPFTREQRMPDQLISAHIVLSRIVGDRGDQEQALALLTELEQIGNFAGLPRAVASARLERARRLLAQGDAAAAREQLARADVPAVWAMVSRMTLLANDAETLTVGRLRYRIRTGPAGETLGELKAELEAAEHAQRHRRALKLRLLYAEALQLDGQGNLAMRTLGKALRFAASEGFVRSFIDEGPVIEGMLRQFYNSRHGEPDDSAGPLPAAHLERLLRASGGGESAPRVATALLEPLTRKEQQVLELLGEGYSNEKMSEKLFISDATVRTHLRSINVKLDARSRAQAVAIARRLGLIR